MTKASGYYYVCRSRFHPYRINYHSTCPPETTTNAENLEETNAASRNAEETGTHLPGVRIVMNRDVVIGRGMPKGTMGDETRRGGNGAIRIRNAIDSATM